MPSDQAESIVEPMAVLPSPAHSASIAPSGRTGAALPLVLLAGLAGLALCFGISRMVGVQPSPWIMAAIFAAAGTSSIAGFAFSAICGAALFHLLGRPVHIVEIMLACSITIQLTSVLALKNAVDFRHLSRFLIGGVVGLPIGIYLLTHISHSLYMHCMGVFLIAYGTYMLFRRPFVCPYTGPLGDYGAGFVGGITGGFAAFPGAFVTIWCGLKGWSKDKQRGVYQPYILIMQLLALAMLFLVQNSHAQPAGLDLRTLSYMAAALLGTWCGLAIFRRLTDLQFALYVNALLIVSGIGLVS